MEASWRYNSMAEKDVTVAEYIELLSKHPGDSFIQANKPAILVEPDGSEWWVYPDRERLGKRAPSVQRETEKALAGSE